MTAITADELKRAINEQQFLIQYQPKMARPDNQQDWVTTEVEALIRWRHPTRGRVAPLDFLPAAIEHGLMPHIGDYVLRKTLQQLRDWREGGLELDGCVNLDASLMRSTRIADHYGKIVAEFGLDNRDITFEVAEPQVNGDTQPLEAIAALRDAGFRVSLDDFGAAREALSTFGRLDFDELKIHASLLQKARENPATRHALAAVTGLAHATGVAVCAEGVEDVETFEFLKQIECDKMQGWFISEAVMPDIIRRCYPAVDEANAREYTELNSAVSEIG